MKDMTAELISSQSDLRNRLDLRRNALLKLFGFSHRPQLVQGARGLQRVTQGAALREVPAFESLGEAYASITGDTEFQRIAQAGLTDFPGALADVMGNLMLRDFAEEYRWREIVSETTSPENYKTQERARAGFIEDLHVMNEDEPYDELVKHPEEAYTFGMGKRGGSLTITRRMIINDQVGLVKRLVEQAGRAAFRTLAKEVWGAVIDNATYGPDATAWFHADHGNLGSTALGVAGLNAARAAIFLQKEPGATVPLGLSGPCLLVVPTELAGQAWMLNSCELDPDDVTKANPWKGKFGPNHERIFVNPLFTDANDWLLVDTSGRAGNLEVAFLMGQQTPQILFANNPNEGQAFLQDRMVYRIRFEFAVAVADYRSAHKSVVAA